MEQADILAVLTEVCGTDPDALEYAAGLLESESWETGEDLWDLVGDFLLDADVVPNEEAGAELASRLAGALRRESGTAPSAAPSAAPAPAPSAPVTLGGICEEVKAASGYLFGDQYGGIGYEAPVHSREVEAPVDMLLGVAIFARWKREKQERREEKRAMWMARDCSESGAVWSALPSGMTGVGGDGNVVLENFSLPNKKGSGDLLSGATLRLTGGRRYGLLGRNGVGKSTLLDAIARREIDGCKNIGSLFYVRQEVDGDGRSALEWVLQADAEREHLLAEARAIEAGEQEDGGMRLAELYDCLAEKESGDEAARSRTVLGGLDFTEEQMLKPTRELSGGWRMRVALACALYVQPSLLLLDEPTNHLDLETVVWLGQYLRGLPSTVLIVSHDRSFLDGVATDIVLMENEVLQCYRGDYANFVAIRAEQRARQERLFEAQDTKREHLQEFVTKHGQAGHNGPSAAAQRKSKQKKLDRLDMETASIVAGRKYKASYDGLAQDAMEAVKEEKKLTLDFPDPGFCVKGPLVQLDDVEFGYGEKPLFKKVNFQVDQTTRAVLLGRNGCGKSTLLNVILGELEAKGSVRREHKARIEYVAQHSMDQLDPASTVLGFTLETYRGDGSDSHELHMRKHLARFQLGGEAAMQRIKTLSGGQKVRLVLALIMFRNPHLLIMDEPTNHLDLETIDAFIEAAETYNAGLLIVSHDQHLIAELSMDLYVMADQRLTRYQGEIADYKKSILARKRP